MERKPTEYNCWNLAQGLHVSHIEREIRELEKRGVLDDTLKKIMKIQEEFGNAFLSDVGLDKNDFKESKDYLGFEPKMSKTLVKKYPHTEVVREIRYY